MTQDDAEELDMDSVADSATELLNSPIIKGLMAGRPDLTEQYDHALTLAVALKITNSVDLERGMAITSRIEQLFVDTGATNGERIMALAAMVTCLLSYDDVTPETRRAAAYILQQACDKSEEFGRMWAQNEASEAVAEAQRMLDGRE